MNGPSWFDQVKARPVGEVAAAFGLELIRRGSDVSFICPACGKVLRHSKQAGGRRSAKVTPDGGGWWCDPCGAKGDAVTLAAFLVTGKPKPAEWAKTRHECAALGLCEHDPRNPNAPTARPYTPPAPKVVEAPKPSRLHAAEVAALWAASSKLDAVPQGGAEWLEAPRVYLAGRGLHPGVLAELNLARVLPPKAYAWPAWWNPSWSEVWRVVVPLYDASGAMVALQARAIAATGDGPKTRNPMGTGVVSGTFFADAGGLEVLRGTYTGPGMVVVEGLTDYLAAAQLAAELEPTRRPAVLGIMAGSSRALTTVNVKASCRLNVMTDNDPSGEKYFREVAAALPDLEGFRVRLRPLNGKRADLSDYLRHHKDTALAALTHGMEGATHGG